MPTLTCKEIASPDTPYVRRTFELSDSRGVMRFTAWGGSASLGSYGGDTWPHDHPPLFTALASSVQLGGGRVSMSAFLLEIANSLRPGESRFIRTVAK